MTQPTLWAQPQFVDFTTAPGRATLWDTQAEDGSRLPITLGVTEDGTVVLAAATPSQEAIDHAVDFHDHRIGHD